MIILLHICNICLVTLLPKLPSSINITFVIPACKGLLHMVNKKILVIGGVATGPSAASKA